MKNYKKPEIIVNVFSKENILCESGLVYQELKDTVAGRKATPYGKQNVSIYNN